MLMIRLQRTGRKHEPTFRVVLTDSHNSTKSGRFLEVLGSHDARKGDPVLNGERILFWIGKGAKASGTVHNLLVTKGILTGKKVNVLPKKTVPKKEESAAEVVAPAAAAAVVAAAPEEAVAEEAPAPEVAADASADAAAASGDASVSN
ncbi:30S ribosomal protein S16 [Candidatus Parcubacteria bacterium]|nr:30S ribosomal protein S16 [Candidatus Parcubacteria bacterium]